MLQKTFSIYNDDLQGCRLFIETGTGYIACWCRNTETSMVKAFELFRFQQPDEGSFENMLREAKLNSKLFDTHFEKVYLVWGNEECIPVPSVYCSSDTAEDYFSLMYGAETCGAYINTVNDITLVSGRLSKQQDAFKKYFPSAGDEHKFSLLLKKYFSDAYNATAGRVHLLFYSGHFIITVIKENLLQLMQSRQYETAEDVLYMILNACAQNGLNPEETKITAGGMIDVKSSLYTALYMYLEGFEIETADKNMMDAEGFGEYPAHYFAPFFNYDV